MTGDVTKHSGWLRYLLCLFVLAETYFLTIVPSKVLVFSIFWSLSLHGGIDNSLSHQRLKRHWLSSPGLADLLKPLLRVGHCCVQASTRMRIECQIETTGGKTALRKKDGISPPPHTHWWCYPTLVSHIPQQHFILWKARLENKTANFM